MSGSFPPERVPQRSVSLLHRTSRGQGPMHVSDGETCAAVACRAGRGCPCVPGWTENPSQATCSAEIKADVRLPVTWAQACWTYQPARWRLSVDEASDTTAGFR